MRSLLCACWYSACARCVLLQVTNDDGSYINKVDVSLFPVSTEMSGALVRIAPGEFCGYGGSTWVNPGAG